MKESVGDAILADLSSLACCTQAGPGDKARLLRMLREATPQPQAMILLS